VWNAAHRDFAGAIHRHCPVRNQPVASGRPYDLEYGNLDYAIADTHKAIQEARRKRIHPFIITSDAKSADYLRRIAPQTQSIIVPRVELLPGLLPAIYKRLTV
jgi:nitric oxide reductase NorD protein